MTQSFELLVKFHEALNPPPLQSSLIFSKYGGNGKDGRVRVRAPDRKDGKRRRGREREAWGSEPIRRGGERHGALDQSEEEERGVGF